MIAVRRARVNEAPALTALAERSKRSWGYDDAFMNAIGADMKVHRHYLLSEYAIVAEIDGVVAGYAIAQLNVASAYVRDLFVDPLYMRRGIGTRLLADIVQQARRAGARELRLVSDPNAVAFYHARGFEVVGAQRSSDIPGRELPVMATML